MSQVKCSVCTLRIDVAHEGPILPEMPPGWTCLTVAQRGSAVRNYLLCDTCTDKIRSFIRRGALERT